MKFPKEKNKVSGIIFTLGAAFLLSLSPKPKFHKKSLYGVWQYVQISKNDKPLNLLLIPSDTMVLTKDHRFSYQIYALAKNASGYFGVIKVPADSTPLRRALVFHYSSTSNLPPGKVRTFNIMKLGDSLLIREGNTRFTYIRKHK